MRDVTTQKKEDGEVTKFSLERALNDWQSGQIKGFEVRVDPSHDERGEHIDLHVFNNYQTGQKYTNLEGVEELKEQLPQIRKGPVQFGF